ncbi:MAG: IclR family transcriptional regulator [Chloroflexota bacterium]
MATRDEPSSVQSVDKALSIIEVLLRDARTKPARDIADQTGVNRTTAHRLLNALIQRGWAERVPGSSEYGLGWRFMALMRIALDQRDLFAEVRPILETLSDTSRETVHLGVMDGMDILHVDKVDSPEAIGVSSKIGSRAVPHLTGLGKAILAASDRDSLDQYIRYALTLTGAEAMTDPDRFREELRQIAAAGYSVDDEEASPGVRCLGMAIRGADGAPLFAISVTGPAGRFTRDRLQAFAPTMLDVGRQLSGRFGWEEPE